MQPRTVSEVSTPRRRPNTPPDLASVLARQSELERTLLGTPLSKAQRRIVGQQRQLRLCLRDALGDLVIPPEELPA